MIDAKIVVLHPPNRPAEHRVEKSADGKTWVEVITFTGRKALRQATNFVKLIKGGKI